MRGSINTQTTPPVASARPDFKRVALGLAALLILPGFILVDSALAHFRNWTLPDWTTAWVIAGAGGLALLILLVAAIGAWRPIGRNAPQLWMLVIVTGVMLAGAEWVMRRVQKNRIARATPAHMHLRPANTVLEYNPNPQLMPGISGKAVFRVNSRGLRGDEMPPRDKAYRIICVGGSTTECSYLDQDEAWPKRVGDELMARQPGRAVWVGGAGISGHRLIHHVAFVREAQVAGEVDCIIVLAGINDLVHSVSGGKGPPVKGTRTRAREAARKKAMAANARKSPLWSRLAIFTEIQRISEAPADSNIMAEDFLGLRYDARRQLRMSATKVDQTPALEKGLAEYQALLKELVKACEARKLRLVLVNQPVLWKPDSPPEHEKLFWFGWLPDGKYVSTRALREGIDRYNAAMAQVAAEAGVELVDLASMSGNADCFCDDCHFSEAGSRQVARLIGEAMVAKKK